MWEFVLFAVVGFAAQIVDGALGMAYGVVSTTVLLSAGVSPAHASAAVHAAEVFTSGAASGSHVFFKNIDWKLFVRLAPFGMVGGVLGAYVLSGWDGYGIRPFVTTYLAIVGLWIFIRSFRKIPSRPVRGSVVMPLGAAGGFLDAAGGGGWGPIVTTGLLGAGGAPRYILGTVALAEFVITLSVSATFIWAMATGHWEQAKGFGTLLTAIGGLIAGGLVAAPIAGKLVAHGREKFLLRAVGALIMALAAFQTWQFLRTA